MATAGDRLEGVPAVVTGGILFFAAAWHIAVHELLLVIATGIALSTIDDCLIDAAYFALSVKRRGRPATAAADLAGPCDWMAIIVPAWDEAAVIGDMLRDLTSRLEYPRYRIFVGSYINDPATRDAVLGVGDARIASIVIDRAGPTTKADCLNGLWQAVVRHETSAGIRFGAIVLHDAEDVVDARELRVFDHLIPSLAMVQLPVIPLVDATSRWVSGHYLDEFAELHGKELVVRGAIGAAVPSAGVACAIDRNVLGLIAGTGNAPFDPTCMTEDYEIGIKIAALGGRGALVRMHGVVGGRPVATREHFPATLEAAIQQKTRWLLGITLSGWDRLGWPGGWADRYMLVRDRKAIIAPLLTMAGYAVMAMVLVDVALAARVDGAARFKPLVIPGTLLAALLWINAVALGWRLGFRAGFTLGLHGWREGLRAVPRTLVGNWINARAAIRAINRYRRIRAGHEQPRWDKTAHKFPALAQ